MSKLTIIGKGTVGCLSAAHFHKFTNWEIDWIYDPNTPAWSVGEGTTLRIPKLLHWTLNWQSTDLYKLQGTPKLGIMKENWGKNNYLHPFPLGDHGIHMNATELQKVVFEKLSSSKRVNTIEKKIKTYKDIDSDSVMVCAGRPTDYDETYEKRTGIPVNAVYVVQCYWDNPEFLYSLTNAMKHGWIFGIPLQNRVSIGYLYNKDITSLEEVKEDIKNVFEQYDLTPSEDTNQIIFNNYSKIDNFEEIGKIVYNGTASFFLEPLEATSLANADQINRLAWDFWKGNKSLGEVKEKAYQEVIMTENMINLHYLAGSKFESKFWDYAKANAEKHYKKQLETNERFKFWLKELFNNYEETRTDGISGTWGHFSWKYNLENLGIYERIKEDIKNV